MRPTRRRCGRDRGSHNIDPVIDKVYGLVGVQHAYETIAAGKWQLGRLAIRLGFEE